MKLLAFCAALLLCSGAWAQSFHVAPTVSGGSDANPCTGALPCATFQRAADLCPTGGHCTINAAPGVYSQKTNIVYYKVISIVGPVANGVCTNPFQVIVDDKIAGTPTPGVIFHAQDHAIMTLQCLTLASYATGSIGFATRQYTIGDANDVACIQFPGGVCFAVNEGSRINIASPGVYGSGSAWASASDHSALTVSGTITANGPAFDAAFVRADAFSKIGWTATLAPGSTIGGYSYTCRDSIIVNAGTIPGGGAAPGNLDCKLR